MSFLKNTTSPLSDAELVQQYKTSADLQVLGALYQRYMDLVYGVCLKYFEQPDDAKDAVLSIFEELVIKVQKHEIQNFKSWLYSVTKNHCLMQLRKDKKVQFTPFDAGSMQSAENVHLNSATEQEEQFHFLETCLEQLTTEQRQVVELFYKEGKCYNEISDRTGLEWNKVRSFIQNGRRNLKICMEKEMLKSTV